MEENKIIIYQTEDGQTQIDVRLENDTVWLTTNQMASLFQKEESNIRRHIINLFNDGEIDRDINVQKIHVIGVKKPVPIYDLDAIIAVGYRVHSKRGVAFRIWARKIIKEYLIKGYAVNERIRKEQIGELRQLVGMLGRTIQNQPLLSNDETHALFEVVTDYTYALDTLDSYDYERLTIAKTTKEGPFHATYENAIQAINALREKFGGSTLFGNEKDDSFKSSIGQIYQTFGGEELENMVYANQQAYYDAITASTSAGQSGPFIDFMLNEIFHTLKEHQGEPLPDKVPPEVPNKFPNKVPNKLRNKYPELSDAAWDVYTLIKGNSHITSKELGATLGISDRMVRKYISLLREANLIVRMGSNKTGYWKVLMNKKT